MGENSSSRGGLTSRDKRFLKGEWKGEGERQVKSHIVNRMNICLNDFGLLNEGLEPDLQKKIFENIEPREVLPEMLAFVFNGLQMTQPELISVVLREGILRSELEVDRSELYGASVSDLRETLSRPPDVDQIKESLDRYTMRHVNNAYEEELTPREIAKIQRQRVYERRSWDEIELDGKELTFRTDR